MIGLRTGTFCVGLDILQTLPGIDIVVFNLDQVCVITKDWQLDPKHGSTVAVWWLRCLICDPRVHYIASLHKMLYLSCLSASSEVLYTACHDTRLFTCCKLEKFFL